MSPNKEQINKSFANLDCYQELIKQIKDDDQFREKLMKIRASKIRGESDPVTVAQAFRLIGKNEMIGVLDANEISSCEHKIGAGSDFRGIRIIDEELVVIEIKELDRYTLTEQYSRGKTKEFHRLISSSTPIDKTRFYFGTEHQIWRDTIEAHLVYEITHLIMPF